MLIRSDDLLAFFHRAAQKVANFSDIIVPVKSRNGTNGRTFFTYLSDDKDIVLNSFRTVDPPKVLFYLARERMAPEEFEHKKRLILGVKQCDLRALQLMDQALINDEFVDPAYKHWRENATIVTTDCQQVGETCHCTLVDGAPYADSGFDLNLSQINDDYLVTVGSEKGKALVELMKKEIKVSEAPQNIKDQVKENRQKVLQKVKQQNAAFARSDLNEQFRQVDLKKWANESDECIGCGACTNICPTCYCLILNDESKNKKFVKERSYDSCQWNGYGLVAGGGTPRPDMTKRFRNRYLCKFDYMQHNFDKIGCTGCGRCTEACAANIDFRQVVFNIDKEAAAV